MSLDNSLKSFLKEDNTNSTIPSSGNVTVGLNDEEQEHLLGMINSMLVILTDTPALNPYYILERIKTRLKLTLGLTFDDTYFLGEIGSFEKPLVPVNLMHAHTHGMFGQEVIDNGWLNKFPHGLTLKVQFVKSGPLYHLNAEVFPCPDLKVPPPISED
jgi:hypothetical protein